MIIEILFYAQEILLMGNIFSEIIYPPKKLPSSNYICDKKFLLDEILEMYEPELKIGVILVSGSIAKFYFINKTGSNLEHVLLKSIDIDLQKRQKKGGQSAQRIGRIRDEKEMRYVNHVAELAVNFFMKDNNTAYICKNIIIGGSSNIKHKVIATPLFQQYFNNRVSGIIDMEIKENSIFELITNNIDLINNSNNDDNEKHIQDINLLISQASDKLVFGYDYIYKNLTRCSLETIYIDSNIDPCILKKINELLTYDVRIINCNLSNTIYVDCVGIKFY